MRFTSFIDNFLYRYKIEKYDYINDCWFFKYGSLSFVSAKRLLKNINETGIYRLIKCYDINEVKD